MRPQKINDSTLLLSLMKVLRNKGYNGASLNEFSIASGLKKASLYYRFPGGKEEIAHSVFKTMDAWVMQHITEVLVKDNKPPKDKLNNVLSNLNQLYDEGKEICFLRAMSIGDGKKIYAECIKAIIEQWTKAFCLFGLSLGKTQEEANENAIFSMVIVQGSLQISNGLNNPTHFKNGLQRIRNLYFPEG